MRKLAYAALPIAASALVLTACGPQTRTPANDPRPTAGQSAAPAADRSPPETRATTSPPAAQAGDAVGERAGDEAARAPDIAPAPEFAPGPEFAPPAAPVLAFAHRYGMALPARQVRPLMEAHQEACDRAGPAQCQVVGVQMRSPERDEAEGELTLRATPAWMRLFRDRLEGDARDAGGRLMDAATDAEDVAPTIEAASDQEQSLMDQRQALLQQIGRADGKTVAELREALTQIEDQLAQARTMRQGAEGRAAMATLTVEYRSNGLIRATGDGAPLADALSRYWRNTAHVAAGIVDIASVLTPIALIVAPIWWLIARRRRISAPAPSPPGAQQAGS